ncbi:acetyl-CoA hydrolase/transferase C-terminal domain-containing protein [Desulfoluna spongiiphila]|uniref:acetyl-CoA hydrolase/transferase C-terminal domain-containing protein n=1 Tax=Desulfoluna spongiiphila TaxID=419481 RepID=UPI00125B9785|nr:acetyl-CoA hydrolase/transferase C-terminal domain-containing protein [Desulfoluna spongiiphila]VVS95027.1 nagb/rpia transferase-like [Desulfoluna spongiiphila]
MSEHNKPTYYTDVTKVVDHIIEAFDKKIAFGMPIALGKSYQIANEIYRRAKSDPTIELTIITALSLEKPTWSNDLERRMLQPLRERVWKGIPDFDYMLDLRKGALPPNVKMKEFYYKAGSVKNDPMAQQNHYSSNYTHVGRDIMNEDCNVLYCHAVAKKEIDGKVCYSDSCNADLSLDIKKFIPEAKAAGKKFLHVGHVNNSLPFMYGDAVVGEDDYDIILDNPEYETPLFSVPKAPVTTADHMIGLHVSSLVQDGGSLQIGIGSLGDAIASALIMRNTANADYKKVLEDLGINEKYGTLVDHIGGRDTFDEGLYGTTEMLVDAFIELYKGGVIKRKVYGNIEIQRLVNEGVLAETLTRDSVKALLSQESFQPILKKGDFEGLQHYGVFKEGLRWDDYAIVDGDTRYSTDLRDGANLDAILDNCIGESLTNGVIAHGGFFIGPNQFYDTLRNMSDDERKLFEMTGVAVLNQLYGDEKLRTLQRRKARFVNAGMIVSVVGNIASDALENGTVISGVGGQYNFVSMAHAIDDARLIMMIRAVKETANGPKSNVVFNYGYTTVPRHLKDIVVTEYGIADLRGKVDHEVVAALINVADSRFQDELLEKAKKAKKLPPDYEIPAEYRNNYPEVIAKRLQPFRAMGKKYFDVFPFGCEFTKEELVLGRSLREFKSKMDKQKIKTVMGLAKQMLTAVPAEAQPYLKRMQLDHPGDFKEKVTRKLVAFALKESGQI